MTPPAEPALPVDLTFLRGRPALRRVAAVTLAVLVAGALYAFLGPRWYSASVSVVPTKSQRSGGLSSLLGGELGSLAAGLGAATGEGADVNRVSAVLSSVAVSDAVIARFGLVERYRERYLESARETLWEHCAVKTLPKPGIVTLTCEDKDPRFAQQMLEFFADYGNQVFRRVSVSSATEQVRFLERRVAELKAAAEETAARMRAFQEKHGIVDIETQTKAVVGSIAALNSQRIAKQLELDLARTFASGDEPTTRQLESQVAVVERKLRALESAPEPGQGAAPPAAAGPRGLFPPALSVPKLRAEFEGLYRDRKVSEATLVFALERLESAKADEAKDTSTFVVLDPPALPTRAARPRKLVVLALSGLAGLLLGILLEWRRQGSPRLFPPRPAPPA